MHVASCLAGLAFNSASLGITHSMAHQLGALFHIPHGRANAMLLPHIVEFNANINKHSRSQKEYLPAVKRYANIAHILGLSNYNEVMSVRSLVNWIQFMQKEMNIPLTIQEIGTITPDAYFAAVDKMAEAALADACTPHQSKSSNERRYYQDLYEAVVVLKRNADRKDADTAKSERDQKYEIKAYRNTGQPSGE